MDYKESLEYLFSQVPMFQSVGASAYKPGLGTSIALAKEYGNPQNSFRTIHVAGTNGKGSVSHTLTTILQLSGYTVGLYTSPHLIDFRERIRVNGKMIPCEDVVGFVESYKAKCLDISPSFFELTMMMAFDHFRKSNVDVAIIEVGLGGRLDSTNIIMPELCVITNISFDHMQFLGNTLPEIASEKAGIIKHGIPVVIGEADGDVRKVFEEKAMSVGAPIIFAEDNPEILSGERIAGNLVYDTKRYGRISSELTGECQIKNANTILSAVDQLKSVFDISGSSVNDAFEQVCELTGLMGRWSIMGDNPKIVCDTGHNEGGIKYIVDQLRHESYDALHIVLGFVNDKDVRDILKLFPHDANYYFTNAQIPRAMKSCELKNIAEESGLAGECYESVKSAFDAAMNAAKSTDFIYVGGSTFVVADFLSFFKRQVI